MIRFAKAHACGNDFLIVDQPLEEAQYSDAALTMCARHTGIGADGVEYLSLADNGGFSIRLFNADGTEVELSGNGTRCVAAYLAQDEEAETISIRTQAGVRHCRILERNHPRYRIEMEMGIPSVEANTITLKDGSVVAGFTVFVGNPHYVIFVDEPDFHCFGQPWQKIGEEICRHRSFPKGTNVEFVRVTDTNRIQIRIYERGVGPTQSLRHRNLRVRGREHKMRDVARKLAVVAEGGEQTVEWPENNASLRLTGPAEIIAQGEFLLA